MYFKAAVRRKPQLDASVVMNIPYSAHQLPDQLMDGFDVLQSSSPSETPAGCIRSHAILPLVLLQCTRIVAVATSVEPAVVAHHVVPPAVVCDHSIFHGAEICK